MVNRNLSITYDELVKEAKLALKRVNQESRDKITNAFDDSQLFNEKQFYQLRALAIKSYLDALKSINEEYVADPELGPRKWAVDEIIYDVLWHLCDTIVGNVELEVNTEHKITGRH